ncbi:MAG: hypothetical protein COB62_01545 [Piscirickettsiaceae bacterium]|nr:MAG: hypothetical protein COB62_01545 [Piscirickettsiaceae bacterium]
MNILTGLKELFEPESTTNAIEENPNFVTRPNRIKYMLHVLMEARVQVTLIMDDKSEHASQVLDIAKKGIVLDQLTSRAAHNKLTNSKSIRIDAKHQSIPFNFNSVIIDNKMNRGTGYLISFPEKIYHPQKRAFFRLSLAHAANRYKFIGSVQYSENTITGYVYDISYGGISIAVTSNTYIKKGDILAPASLTLDNDQRIECDFIVRSVKKSAAEGFIRIGCCFLNLPSTTKSIIHELIRKQERNRAKKSSELS